MDNCVSLKAKGSPEAVKEFREFIDKHFENVVKSQIILNDQDSQCHCFLDVNMNLRRA